MKCIKLLFLAVFFSSFSHAQVGVNATEIHPSAALDIQYGTNPKGLLTPRMTTEQRTGIANAANGLLVFDTDLKSFYYNEGTSAAPVWVRINSGAAGRTNFRRIQSEADLIASSTLEGGNYQLYTNTFYEINGTINLTKSIDLNNAYVAGVDANEDILSFTGGTVFKGNTGGSIKNITLKGGTAFEITGPGFTSNSSLLIQNTIIDGMTASVGSISGLGLYYGGIVQFMNNKNGITYSNIGNCLLDNQAWLDTNDGTFETFTGNFGLVEKASGFSSVNGTDIAFDVSTKDLAIGTGTLSGTVFSGTSTGAPGYIKGYATGLTYTGYNFSNAWYVDSPGIPREGDAAATGNLYKVVNSTTPANSISTTNAAATNTAYPVRTGTIAEKNLFRFTSTAEDATPATGKPARLTYTGNKTRAFQASATVSFKAPLNTFFTDPNTDYVFYFAIISATGTITPLTETETYIDTNSGLTQSFPISGTIVLARNESVGLYLRRIASTGTNRTQIDVYSYNLSLK